MQIGCEVDFGDTPLWTRVNSLDSPWALDDITTLVGGIGDRRSVMMVPKVEGPWDIHYVDRLLAQLEAKHQVKKPILVHAVANGSTRGTRRTSDVGRYDNQLGRRAR